MRCELLRMWAEGIIRGRTNGELKKKLTEQIRNELFPKKYQTRYIYGELLLY